MARSSGTWKKGQGGKPKGALNKTTKEAHELFMYIMNGQVGNIKEALVKIKRDDPEKYINALSKLFQYYLPRKTEVEATIHLPEITKIIYE